MTTFSNWLRNHPCSSRELWVLQNCIGSVFGFDHPVAKEAAEIWNERLKLLANPKEPTDKQEEYHTRSDGTKVIYGKTCKCVGEASPKYLDGLACCRNCGYPIYTAYQKPKQEKIPDYCCSPYAPCDEHKQLPTEVIACKCKDRPSSFFGKGETFIRCIVCDANISKPTPPEKECRLKTCSLYATNGALACYPRCDLCVYYPDLPKKEYYTKSEEDDFRRLILQLILLDSKSEILRDEVLKALKKYAL